MIKGFKLPKLALNIIGYLTSSVVIAFFSFGFLYFTSSALIERSAPGELDPQLSYMIVMICALGSMVVFFAFFLLFLGKKISYILSINKGVQILKNDLTFSIETQGDDELAQLAETINSFAGELDRYKKNEDKLKKEKQSLTRSLSHDIRTPLTAIISYADFIKEKQYKNDENLERYIEVIQTKADQIKDLTDLLLDVDQRKVDITDEPIVEGKLLFQQFISELEGALEDKDFNVDLDKNGLRDFKIRINIQDVTRIFDNLYSNIIKYADPKEKIGIKVFLKENYLIIEQSNKIKKKDIKKSQSHGIGLKSIEQIIKKYKGDMNVTKSPEYYKIELKIEI
nr:HAMP domain-containing sensor histidine kinase [Tissierella sp.]